MKCSILIYKEKKLSINDSNFGNFKFMLDSFSAPCLNSIIMESSRMLHNYNSIEPTQNLTETIIQYSTNVIGTIINEYFSKFNMMMYDISVENNSTLVNFVHEVLKLDKANNSNIMDSHVLYYASGEQRCDIAYISFVKNSYITEDFLEKYDIIYSTSENKKLDTDDIVWCIYNAIDSATAQYISFLEYMKYTIENWTTKECEVINLSGTHYQRDLCNIFHFIWNLYVALDNNDILPEKIIGSLQCYITEKYGDLASGILDLKNHIYKYLLSWGPSPHKEFDDIIDDVIRDAKHNF